MTNSVRDVRPQVYARVGGILYLVIIGLGTIGELVTRGSFVVSGNASATAANILASPFRWRMGIAGDLVMHVCDVGVMIVLYVLLRPVNRNLALAAVLFTLVQTSVLLANKLNLLLPLFLLGDAPYLNAFTPEQRQALSFVALRTHDYGFAVGLTFFGMACIVVGYLIVRAAYLPSTIGVLMQVAGACYLINSFSRLLDPPLASRLAVFILLPAFIAELSLALWLLVKRVDLRRWSTQQI